MTRRKIISIVVIAIISVLSLIGVYEINREHPPDFDLILLQSGLQFQKKPQVSSWKRECSGLFCNDVSLTVEFKFDHLDISLPATCQQSNYKKGIPSSVYISGLVDRFQDLSLVCWQQFGSPYNGGRNFYAMYGDILLFIYDLN